LLTFWDPLQHKRHLAAQHYLIAQLHRLRCFDPNAIDEHAIPAVQIFDIEPATLVRQPNVLSRYTGRLDRDIVVGSTPDGHHAAFDDVCLSQHRPADDFEIPGSLLLYVHLYV
jgi:hypothetical protein